MPPVYEVWGQDGPAAADPGHVKVPHTPENGPLHSNHKQYLAIL